MAKIFHLFSKSDKQERLDKIRKLFIESVDNTIPLMVIKVLLLLASVIAGLLLLSIGIFPDPIVNKIIAVMALTGVFVLYFVLGSLYYFEKKTGMISAFLKKRD